MDTNGDFHGRDTTFFEHQDVHAAEYELFSKIEKFVKKLPKAMTDEQLNGEFREVFHGDQHFDFRGIRLNYTDYLTLIELPGKNPLFRAKHRTWSVVIIEPKVITLDQYFDSVKVGESWPTERRTALKIEYSENED